MFGSETLKYGSHVSKRHTVLKTLLNYVIQLMLVQLVGTKKLFASS